MYPGITFTPAPAIRPGVPVAAAAAAGGDRLPPDWQQAVDARTGEQFVLWCPCATLAYNGGLKQKVFLPLDYITRAVCIDAS